MLQRNSQCSYHNLSQYPWSVCFLILWIVYSGKEHKSDRPTVEGCFFTVSSLPTLLLFFCEDFAPLNTIFLNERLLQSPFLALLHKNSSDKTLSLFQLSSIWKQKTDLLQRPMPRGKSMHFLPSDIMTFIITNNPKKKKKSHLPWGSLPTKVWFQTCG